MADLGPADALPAHPPPTADELPADEPPRAVVLADDDSTVDEPFDDEPFDDEPFDDEAFADEALADRVLADGPMADQAFADEARVGPAPMRPRPGRAPAVPVEPPVATPYGSRREARERALSLLYEADAKGITPAALLQEIPVEPPAYVTSLVAGVGERRAQIDQLIVRYAIDWTIDRMPVIDRTVVRMATFELMCRPDVPTGVVISEAVELAKRYSTPESGRFVNGLLASITSEVRPRAE